MEIGQIINGVNNIWNLCKNQAAKKGKRVASKNEVLVTDEKDVLEVLLKTLDKAY